MAWFLVLALALLAVSPAHAGPMEANGFAHFPGGTISTPPSMQIAACDGWEVLYIADHFLYGPGFYQIYGRAGGPSWWSADVWVRGPIQLIPHHDLLTPFCGWLMALPVMSWGGGWGVYQMPDGPNHLVTYHAWGGYFADHGHLPAGLTYEAPYLWPRPPGEDVWAWGWHVSDRPIIARHDGAYFATELDTGLVVALAPPRTEALARARTPWDPALEAELAAYYATAALYNSWPRYFALEHAMASGRGIDTTEYLEMSYLNQLTFQTARDNHDVAAAVVHELASGADSDQALRASIAYTRALIATEHLAQLFLVMTDMAYLNRLIIADWFPAEIPMPPFPTLPDPPLPESSPAPPPPVSPPPPSGPILTDSQKEDLRIVANYIDYGHRQGWSDQTICLYICPVIRNANLGPVLQDPAYSAVVADTLRGFSPGLVQDYGALISTLNTVGSQQVQGFQLIQTIN